MVPKMSLISSLVNEYKRDLLAKIAPEVKEAEMEAIAGYNLLTPFIQQITPAQELAALKVLFPAISEQSLLGLISGIKALIAVAKKLQKKIPDVTKV
jgi:hypothetical protein